MTFDLGYDMAFDLISTSFGKMTFDLGYELWSVDEIYL